MKTIKSIFNKPGKFFGRLWQIFAALLAAPWRLDYKSDCFEQVFSFGPFILWYDVITEWILFIRQREPGYHMVAFEIPASTMNILYRLGQFKSKLALSSLIAFLLNVFNKAVWVDGEQVAYEGSALELGTVKYEEFARQFLFEPHTREDQDHE